MISFSNNDIIHNSTNAIDEEKKKRKETYLRRSN